jgi:mannose-1-phosphate guanylyltransferase
MIIEHVIVMAASPGRDMESLTRTRPKAMLPIVGKPMIVRVMNSFYKAGIRRFTVVVGEREGSVAEWLSSKWHPDAQLAFAPQGHRRGTASTLFATRSLIDGPFIIASCDTLVPEEHVTRLCQYFEKYPVDATALSLYYAPEQVTGVVSVLLDPRGRVIYISEKKAGGHQAHMTALPIYGFTPKVLDYLDRVPVVEESGERPLTTAIQMMIDDRLPVGAIEAAWAFYLDTPDALMRASRHFLSQLKMPSLLSDVPTSVEITPPVHIDPGVIVGERARIGPNVYLETGSVIGYEAVLKDALVLGRQVGSKQKIEAEIVDKDRI